MPDIRGRTVSFFNPPPRLPRPSLSPLTEVTLMYVMYAKYAIGARESAIATTAESQSGV